MPVDGTSLAVAAAGTLFLYAGIKGKSVLATFQSVLTGQSPGNVPATNLIGGSGSSNAPVNQTTANQAAIGIASGGKVSGTSSIQNMGLAQLVASTYGWGSGQEFADLTHLINQESGGNPNATNPTSGAYGIGQALGHGTSSTAGSVTNQYGGYGVPDATCRAANSGDAQAQLIWMMAYIQQTYGDPINAWAHEVSAGWY